MERALKESLGIDQRHETGREVVDWIHLYMNRDQWQDPVNVEMNFSVP
jgi:hypothetical protein